MKDNPNQAHKPLLPIWQEFPECQPNNASDKCFRAGKVKTTSTYDMVDTNRTAFITS